MRAKNSDLFDLIQLMSVNEHKYFIKFLREKNNKLERQLEQLFNTIKKQKSYDESIIKNQIKDPDIVKFFAQKKKVLTDYIEACLIRYYRDGSIEVKIHELLQLETIFRRKALYNQCQKLMDKAQQIAFDYEYYYLEVEIIKRKIVLTYELFPKDIEEQLNSLISQKKAALLKLVNEQEYRDLKDRLFVKIRKKNAVRDKETRQELDELMSNPLLKNENNALSLSARLYFHSTHSNYNKLVRNFTKSLEHRKRIVELWTLQPNRIQEKPYLYVTAICNLLGNYHYLNNYTRSEELIREAKEVKVRSETDNAFIFQQVRLHEILLYINTCQFDKLADLVPEIESGLEDFDHIIQNSYKLSILFNLSLAFFITENYKAALHWVNKIVNMEKTEERLDIQDFSKILRLLIFYCDGKHDIILNYHRSASRMLKRNNRLYNLERIILKNLSELIAKTPKEQEEIYIKFSEELKSIGNNGNANILGIEETGLWLESKIRKVPMQQILADVNEQAQQKRA